MKILYSPLVWRHGWCVCPEAGLGWTCWQQWQTINSLWITHQAAASQELHLWSRSFWAHGLNRACVEWTGWKDETENKTKHVPGQLLSFPPGGIRPPLWETFCGWGTLQRHQWKSWAEALYESSFKQLLSKLHSSLFQPFSMNLLN